MPIILRDDFDGSGTLEGHAANVNTLGSGAVWSATGNAALSGGHMVAPSPGYAVGTMFASGAAVVGEPLRFTFRWQPAGNQSAYSTVGAIYPIGINFGSAMVWLFNGPSGCSMQFMAFGELFATQSVPVTFSAGNWYDGEILVADGLQTLNFLGQTVTLGDEMLPASLKVSVYMNMYTLDDGTSGRLDFIQAENVPIERFWTRLVGTQELQS